MTTIEVTRTYLEMRSPEDLRPGRTEDPLVRLAATPDCSIALFRELYSAVGRDYHWVDRLSWTDDQVRDYLQQPEISLWLMTYEGERAGYFELRQCDDDSVEVAYFGLLPEFIGRGLGKHLLTCAIEQAWQLQPNRVWLHTCTLDDQAALPNYLKRGFRPFKTENYLAEIQDRE